MPKVSIIIPVYNVERYLHRCIDSVLNQTLQDIEIILIDDGSTDSSPDICDGYGSKYQNIRVFHKENGGASSARNLGIEKATGEYIGFVDSDDYISPDMYEKLYTALKDFDCEIAMCNYQTVKDNKALRTGKIGFVADARVCHDECVRLMQTAHESNYLWFNWNKLYSYDVIKGNNIRFDTGIPYGEDTPFVSAQ